MSQKKTMERYFPCPTCGAKKWEACFDPDGQTRIDSHPERPVDGHLVEMRKLLDDCVTMLRATGFTFPPFYARYEELDNE